MTNSWNFSVTQVFTLCTLLLTYQTIICGGQSEKMSTTQKSCGDGKAEEGVCSSDDKTCSLTPISYEGPFFLPNMPVRNDIREGKPGIPFNLKLVVKDKNCSPVKDAQVHLWHADAFGIYSAYSEYYPLGSPMAKQITGGHAEPSEKATFLRGIQNTDDNGEVNFLTIYPGWYSFRSLHVHLKITIDDASKFTGEIYFPDELTEAVSKVEPYKQHSGRRLKNNQDEQFVNEQGAEMLLRPNGNPLDGYDGSLIIVINV